MGKFRTFRFHVLRDDQQRALRFQNRFQHRQKAGESRDSLFEHKHVRVLELALLRFRVRHKVGRDVPGAKESRRKGQSRVLRYKQTGHL